MQYEYAKNSGEELWVMYGRPYPLSIVLKT
jgi:hypothetical protein